MRWVKEAWELPNSLIINPTKRFCALDFSVIYVRDLERLRRCFFWCLLFERHSAGGGINYMITAIQLAAGSARSKRDGLAHTFGRTGMVGRIRPTI